MRTLLTPIAACLAALLCCSAAVGQQNLPEDREQYHLVVVTHDQPTPAGLRLLAQVDQDPQLSRIAAACATHKFKASDVLYRDRYAAGIPATELPAIALCRGDGGVVYKAAGANVPSSAAKLVEDLMYYARLDRSLSGGGGVAQQDCPNCPNYPQPNPPVGPWIPQPDAVTVPWRNPDGGALLPLRIPDSIEVAPRLGISMPEGLGGWLIGGGLILLVLIGVAAFAFCVCVGFAIYLKG